MAISAILLEFVHQFPNSYTLAWIWGILVILSKYALINAFSQFLNHFFRFFYVISFIFSSIRIMRVFAADSFFGSIVVMMKKMVRLKTANFWCFQLFRIIGI